MAEKIEGTYKGPARPMTKDELLAENDELRQKLALAEAANKLVADVAPGTSGWIVETDNPEYNGNTIGVVFIGGRGFIPVSHPNAEFLLRELEHEFHYRIVSATPDMVERMRTKSAELAAQADAETAAHVSPLTVGEQTDASKV